MLGRKSLANQENSEPEKRSFDDFELRLGDIMRGERATLGKSLLDVQRELKIKAAYVAAVENCDYSVFETPGFIAGYVRSYARFLGLDPEWAFARFCQESGFTGLEGLSTGISGKSKTAASSPRLNGEDAIVKPVAPYTPRAESVLSQIEPGAIGSLTVMLALIGAIGYGGWSILQEIQRVDFAPVEQAPGIVADLDVFPQDLVTQDQSVSLAENFGAPSADALERLYRPQQLDAPILTERDGPIAALNPNSIGALVEKPQGTIAALESDIFDLPPEFAQVEPPRLVAPPSPNVVMFAVRPAWVRVSAADGTVLLEKTLNKGETYTVPITHESPRLRAGNAGAVYFNVMGATFGPVGVGASVAKNVKISMDDVVGVFDVADLEADPELADVMRAMADTGIVVEDGPNIE